VVVIVDGDPQGTRVSGGVGAQRGKLRHGPRTRLEVNELYYTGLRISFPEYKARITK
jgi:hypothetical protein